MLKLIGSDKVRLTPKEAERLTLYTGYVPVGINTLGDFHNYIDRCKRLYEGYPATSALHAKIDEAALRCLNCAA